MAWQTCGEKTSVSVGACSPGCHPERSEGSRCLDTQILRCAQDDRPSRHMSYGLAKPLPVAALWIRVEELSVHYDAHGAFMTLPRHTSTRKDNVQPDVSAALRLPVHQAGFPTRV